MKLQFKRRDDYHLESVCREYTVAKYPGPKYIAWKRRAIRNPNGDWYPDMIGMTDFSPDAIALCQADADRRRTAA